MATIFLSYSRKDTAVMQQVKQTLLDAGVSVWTDEGIPPGTPVWERAIEKALRKCEGVVIIQSPDSAESDWVRRELTLADEFGKFIFPLLARGASEESTILRISTTQRIDIRTNFDVGLDRLLKDFAARGWTKKAREERKAAQRLKPTTKFDWKKIPA